jgi:hypothetical protein
MELNGFDLARYLPLLLPFVLIQLGLLALAVWDWAHRQQFRYLSRWAWLVIIVLVNTFGPLVYLLVGRGESE